MHPRISALVFIFILAVMSRLYSTQTPILTKEDAAELVVTDLLDGNADSVFLFVSRETVPSGEPVLDFTGTVVLTAPSLGWIAFVDDHPAANWEHTCRFVFIDYDTGDYQVYDTTRPPEAIGVLYWAYPNVAMSRFADVDFRAVEPPAPPSNMMYAPGENYAVIISGGANKWMNYVRYWNDVQFAYIILTGVYQFKKENVFLLFSDGLSDTVDMLDSTYMWSIDSPKDYDGDGIPDVYGPSPRPARMTNRHGHSGISSTTCSSTSG